MSLSALQQELRLNWADYRHSYWYILADLQRYLSLLRLDCQFHIPVVLQCIALVLRLFHLRQ